MYYCCHIFPLILHNWSQKFMYNLFFLDSELYIYLSEIVFLAHWLFVGKYHFTLFILYKVLYSRH